MDCRGTACLTMVFIMGCRRFCAPLPGAPPYLFLHWPWCLQSCCSHMFSPLPPGAVVGLTPFLKICYPRGTTTIANGLGLGQLWVLLELACIRGSQPFGAGHRGNLLGASHRYHPFSLPLWKHGHANTIQSHISSTPLSVSQPLSRTFAWHSLRNLLYKAIRLKLNRSSSVT